MRGKPIEPGCLCLTVGHDRPERNGHIVTAVSRTQSWEEYVLVEGGTRRLVGNARAWDITGATWARSMHHAVVPQVACDVLTALRAAA